MYKCNSNTKYTRAKYKHTTIHYSYEESSLKTWFKSTISRARGTSLMGFKWENFNQVVQVLNIVQLTQNFGYSVSMSSVTRWRVGGYNTIKLKFDHYSWDHPNIYAINKRSMCWKKVTN